MSADAKAAHPRRRSPLGLVTTNPGNVPSPHEIANNGMKQVLKKSATFQASSSPSSEYDPILSIPSLPRRSPTSPKNLEDTIAAGDQRIVQLLGAVDRSLSGLQSFSESRENGLADDESPIPRFMVGHESTDDRMDIDTEGREEKHSEITHRHPFPRRRHHSSDSGIGSSESSEASVTGDGLAFKHGADAEPNLAAGASLGGASVMTGINGSGASFALATGAQHALSEYACKQIQKHIILPIIREETLKNFHPLVSGIPYRVARREITCLRDLEKVLLWLAPKWSVSKASFIHFCETSIQCIHATVEFLNENDQRRATDRPYTNGYFLDLVEQIRQYASTLAAARQRSSSGSTDSSASPTANESVTLIGGLGQTGRPAELVKVKQGKMVSLRTSEEVPPESPSRTFKRPSDGEFEEDALRSMARRRKTLGPVTPKVQRCSECDKTFKRPCDLTKHEKTHSRPWKCSQVGCKYREYGWPTEKERDRHMNDKHSAAPNMFKCHFSPCPYESKRESNCKQHMEKAHGWVYIRSKHNGKNGRRESSDATPPTPQMSTPRSHTIDAPTPNFSDAPTRFGGSIDAHDGGVSGTSGTPDPSGDRDIYKFNETFGPVDDSFWSAAATGLGGQHVSQLLQSDRAWEASLPANAVLPANSEDESLFGANFDWSNMEHDLAGVNAQLITPATSVNNAGMDSFSRRASASIGASPQLPQVASISPGGQADAMLYSPYSMNEENPELDEGFDDFVQDPTRRPMRDFSLYDSSTTSRLDAVAGGNMFDEIGSFPAQHNWAARANDVERPNMFDESLLPVDE